MYSEKSNKKVNKSQVKKIHQAVSIPLTPAMPNGAKTHHVPISGHGNLNIKLNPKLYKRFDINFNFRQKIQQICILPSLGINGLKYVNYLMLSVRNVELKFRPNSNALTNKLFRLKEGMSTNNTCQPSPIPGASKW